MNVLNFIKKKAPVVLAVGCCGILLCYGAYTASMAYLQSRYNKTEEFTMGTSSVQINADFEKPSTSDIQIDANGDEYVVMDNTVTFTNISDNDCYVRFRIEPASSSCAIKGGGEANSACDGFGDKNNYFHYYPSVVKAGETTPNISCVGSLYANDGLFLGSVIQDDLKLYVYAETVQAEGFADYKQAFGIE